MAVVRGPGFRVEVYDSVVASLFSPGQPVDREHAKVIAAIEGAAKVDSLRFTRSGAIFNGHYSSRIRIGPYGIRGYVGNKAKHSLFKHEGTRPQITSPGGTMVVPKRKGAGRWTPGIKPSKAFFPVGAKHRKKFVRGQVGVPWISNAAKRVLRSYLR